MKILHLASYDRWTGAAAPAFAEVESLRLHGVDAHYAYVGGYKLERKLGPRDYCHPILSRRQDPISFWRTVRRLKALQKRLRVDLVHAHLSHDHFLAVGARAGNGVVRTLHNRRTLRRDPLTRFVNVRTDAFCVVNSEFPMLMNEESSKFLYTAPPVDTTKFTPEGPDKRHEVARDGSEIILGIIGKIAPGRGFEAAIETLAVLRRDQPAYRLMVIGRGAHRPNLEALAMMLGVDEYVTFVGYHEEGLEEYYRAADVMLFTAPGSDEGHRAVLEELACGIPVAAYPIVGLSSVLGDLSRFLIAPAATPESLASTVRGVLSGDGELERRAVERARLFDYHESGKRLVAFYQSLLQQPA